MTGTVAVVTGGGRGIGRAIALGLGEAGATVVPVARTTSEIDSVAAEIEEAGGAATAIPTDVAEPAAVESVLRDVRERHGGVDVVVNNAGINPEEALGRPETVESAAVDRVLAVNLRGAFSVAARAAEALVAGGGGSIVNVASVGGLVGLPRQHPYVASKHGLVGLTRSLALDLAPEVRVNAVAPGYAITKLTAEIQDVDHVRDSILERTPLGRFADPSEIADPVVFLASDMATYVTGACLAVDGGWTAR